MFGNRPQDPAAHSRLATGGLNAFWGREVSRDVVATKRLLTARLSCPGSADSPEMFGEAVRVIRVGASRTALPRQAVCWQSVGPTG